MPVKTNILLLLINTDKEVQSETVRDYCINIQNKRWQLQKIQSDLLLDAHNNLYSQKILLKPNQYIIFGIEGKLYIKSESHKLLQSASYKLTDIYKNNKLIKTIQINIDHENIQLNWEIISYSNNFLVLNQ